MVDERTTQITMVELAEQAGLDPGVLVTRSFGRRFLPALEAALRDLPESHTLVLDCTGVDIMDASFADEVFGSIAVNRARRIAVGGCFVLRALESSNIDNLTMALASRPVRETGLRNCVLPVDLGQGAITLVGKAEGHVQQTFDLLRSHKHLTARELSDGLQLDIAAASTRLKVLYDLGLATRIETRDSQGKQYIYAWPL